MFLEATGGKAPTCLGCLQTFHQVEAKGRKVLTTQHIGPSYEELVRVAAIILRSISVRVPVHSLVLIRTLGR